MALPFPFNTPVTLVLSVITGVVVAFATLPAKPLADTTEADVTVPLPPPPPPLALMVISLDVSVMVTFVPAISDLKRRSTPTFAPNTPVPEPRLLAVLVSPKVLATHEVPLYV